LLSYFYPSKRFLAGQAPSISVKFVILQFWFDTDVDAMMGACRRARELWPSAKIAFLDAFAPTDLRFACSVGQVVDVYFKKHLLKNRNQYGLPTSGDTNLSDWYGARYDLRQEEKLFEVSEAFKSKLKVYPSFFLAPYLLEVFAGVRHAGHKIKKYDVHARLGGGGDDGWYPLMRKEATEAVRALTRFKVTPSGALLKGDYLTEMSKSLLCFSPFGYGEICWRDFEAIAFGAVLVKPDVSHLDVEPDFFKPWVTYVPVAWDFSDLEDVVVAMSENPELCRRIADNAFQVLSEYVREGRFVDLIGNALCANASD